MSDAQTFKTKDIGVCHYRTGRDSWKVGLWHYWLRVRGLITGLLLAGITMGTPWWWPNSWNWIAFPAVVEMPFSDIVVGASLAASIVIVVLFLYARSRALRSLECKDKLHEMSHIMRDAFCEVLKRTGARMSKHDLAHERRHLLDTSNSIAKSVVDYYMALTRAKCAGAVIRLAEDLPDDGKEETHFVSVGRAGSPDQARAESSEPILATEGIPKLFKASNGNANGVLFFEDLDKAIRHGAYKETENERQFTEDYKYVVAVPLNGFNGKKNDLIGMLTITGRSKKKILCVQHVDLLKAIGDRLAEHYTATIERLSATRRMPDLHNGDENKAESET